MPIRREDGEQRLSVYQQLAFSQAFDRDQEVRTLPVITIAQRIAQFHNEPELNSTATETDMERFDWLGNPMHYRRVVLLGYLLIASVAIGVISWQFRQIDKDTEHIATERGVTLFRLIEITREWNAKHGGVYVPVTPENPPNPYLKHPKRDVVDHLGRDLTMVNPAYMTRQISEIAALRDGVQFHITSLKPIRPENRADTWEAESLALFENAGVKERTSFIESIVGPSSAPAFRYMAPLRVTEPCMKCHESQGYKVGDIRGGISVTMPAAALLTVADERKRWVGIIGALVAGLISALAHLTAWRTHRHFRVLKELNTSLEMTVAERTREINQLYEHEHYLRELLSTVSELNISLIHSYSMGSIIESAIERLKHHQSYKLIMFGHFDGTQCHLRHVIGDRYDLLRGPVRSLDEMARSSVLKCTAEAIRTKHWASGSLDGERLSNCTSQRAGDYTLTASIAFPLIEEPSAVGFDVITFWTDRTDGFDQEEIKILDTVVSDITMALSAYKQRKLSERLYQENINNYEETILAFVDMIEQRDAYTAGHTLRVAKYCRMIAEQLKLDEKAIWRLEKAAILHDIGKIATPDTILLKPGRLTMLEYSLIQMHVTAGYKMLAKVKMYADLAEIIKFHHERHDGKGYPKGYKGEEIPREAQIMIVADAFDAMTTNRIYKGRLTVPDAIAELIKHSGAQFHPEVVDAAILRLKDIPVDEVSQLPTSDLEKQRFSYFFNDNLTGIFNTAYLQLVLNRNAEYICANIIELKKFSEFNRTTGWAAGNELLISVAHQLRIAYPEALLFRFHGDDFLILNIHHAEWRSSLIDLTNLDPARIVKVEMRHFDIRRDEDREEFKEILELE